MRNKYPIVFDTVQKILNEVDPEGFLPGKPNGAPISEYDQETALLVSFLIKNPLMLSNSADLFIKEIDNIWINNYDHACIAARLIAEKIKAEEKKW